MKNLTNNFDGLRIIAATMVLVSHQFALLQLPQPEIYPGMTIGTVAVFMFFVISGYLVTKSWVDDPNISRFAARRSLRLIPGLVVAIALSVFVLGPIVSTLRPAEYFGTHDPRQYLWIIRFRPHFGMPGAFESNPFPEAANGSLWSIPYEIVCYVLMGAVGLVGMMRSRRMCLAAVALLALYRFGIKHSELNAARIWMLDLGLFFSAGALIQMFKSVWIWRSKTLLLCALIFSAVTAWRGHYFVALWLMLPSLTIVCGEASTPVLRRFGRFGDISYGIYIYAFITQQTLILATGARWSVYQYMPVSLAITVCLAFASWHLIERPALSLKPRRRSAAQRQSAGSGVLPAASQGR
jgi:peptidoglycan/LPS O-acetylase OafA/YrhL